VFNTFAVPNYSGTYFCHEAAEVIVFFGTYQTAAGRSASKAL
jgi:hypothetical protein